MDLRNLTPLNIERIVTETEPREVNRLLKDGFLLLLVTPSPDGVGGFYAVYILGKQAPPPGRVTVNSDPEGFDQRNG